MPKSFEVPILRHLVKVDSPVCLPTDSEIKLSESKAINCPCMTVCECVCKCKCECQCFCKVPCNCECMCICMCQCMEKCTCQCKCECKCKCVTLDNTPKKSPSLADIGKEATRNSKLAIKPNLMLRKEEGFGLVFDPEDFAEYFINLTAFDILSAISQGKSVPEAIQVIQESYLEVPDNIATIVETFIGQLIKCKGIIIQV